MVIKKVLAILVVFMLANSIVSAQEQYSYVDLIEMLTDMEYISTLPKDGEWCKQWSSYDRASYYNEKTGKYVNWDANGDGFGGKGWIRIEDGKLVLAEIEGPGCIWRTWSATPQDGNMRIYLDENEQPAVDLPFEDYFSGKVAPFNRSALVNILSQGKNNYTPIPFQKSCKIVADKDYGEFHHFTYTLFPKGTKVPTFKMQLSDEENAALDKANEILSNCGPDMIVNKYSETVSQDYNVKVKPSEKIIVADIKGEQAIVAMQVKMDIPEDIEAQRELARELALSIYWDGEDKPSVWTPLGDFFGTAPGINVYQSLPLGITEDYVLYSNWFMPFEKQALIEIKNDGEQMRELEFKITYAPLQRPACEYARFHAKWHRNIYLPKEKERWIDWTMLVTEGKGRFCGVELQIWNPRGGWWGEGDEKFFVDGEKFPSTYGTGSEDYFGYAWSDWNLFENCYHNQTYCDLYNKGQISVNRWHIMDNVPFQKSFEGTIEKYYADDRPTLYTCVAYWYLDKNGKDPYPEYELSERTGYYVGLSYPLDIAGIVVLEEPEGSIEAQGMHAFTKDKWSDTDHLWWVAEKPGRKVKLQLMAEKAGKYKLLTRLTKAKDYAIVQFYVNGKKTGEPIDLYHEDGVVATKEICLGKVKLKKGGNVVTVEIVGANPNAVKAYMFGMDYLKIK